MNDVNDYHRYGSFLSLLLVTLITACAPVKTLDVWQDETYTKPVQKVLVIAITHEGFIRNQFENVLADKLAAHGVHAIPSNKVLPQLDKNLDRETVVAEVRKHGIDNVLVARAINRKQITNHQYGGVYYGGTAVYDKGWHSYAYGSFYSREYDTDYFTVATKLFDIDQMQPVWTYLSQIKVTGAKQGTINDFIPYLVEELVKSKLIPE